MEVIRTGIESLVVLQPAIHKDQRGYFMETYREELLLELGLNSGFVQDNFSISKKNVLRGLHYQAGKAAQSKLVMVCRGEIIDVAVDIRKKSPTFGQHVSIRLSAENHKIMFIPEGFAHGFSVLSEEAAVFYKCSAYYDSQMERGLRWDDPMLKIDWQVKNPVVSMKDGKHPALAELPEVDLF